MPFRIKSWGDIVTSAATLNGMWINQDLEQDVGPVSFLRGEKESEKITCDVLDAFCGNRAKG